MMFLVSNLSLSEGLQLFLLIPIFLAALYVSVRIFSIGVGIRGIRQSRPRFILCTILTILGTMCLGYMLLSHLELQIRDPFVNRILVLISGTYLAFFIYFLFALTATDIILFLLRHSKHKEKLSRIFLILSVCIAVVLTLVGVTHARKIITRHYDVSAEGHLSTPLRIVEVSDLHMGSVIDKFHVKRVVDAVNAQHPDMVVFLGDQFNRTNAVDVVDADAMFEELSHIEAPLGIYAVLGNHDPDLKEDIYQQYLLESGITALDNGVLEITAGNKEENIYTLVSPSADGSESISNPKTPDKGSLILVGRTKLAKDKERIPLNDLLNKAGIKTAADKNQAESADYYLMILDHDPNGIKEAVSCNTDLIVAGHTHRGQFFPTNLITKLSYPKGYDYGITKTTNEKTGHTTTSIVSSGAGFFQTPIRLGSDTEIVSIDLK